MEVKNNNFLIILLSILLIISCLVAGFFAWQTQKLVKELQVMSDESKSTPVATQTPDPTANWKTYSNVKYKFSIKYPSDMDFVIDNNNDFVMLLVTFKNISSEFKIYIESGYNIVNADFDIFGGGRIVSFEKEEDRMVNNITVETVRYVTEKGKKLTTISIPNGKYTIYINSPTELSNQILSTFKFIEPVTCTMEAKICPDGSSVGRTGPNCEFAPCPASKN